MAAGSEERGGRAFWQERRNYTAMQKYLYEYEHNGSKWAFDIWAEDAEDARARLRKLAHAKYSGEVIATIPVNFGWLAKAWCFLANTARKLRGSA